MFNTKTIHLSQSESYLEIKDVLTYEGGYIYPLYTCILYKQYHISIQQRKKTWQGKIGKVVITDTGWLIFYTLYIY